MKRFAAALLFLFLASSASSQGLEDWYKALADIAGIDPHAGKAAFWTLVIPPGGMYQAMGTAYSAVLRDSGYMEANPAGSALLKDTEISIYHNDWIGESRLEAAVFTIRDTDLGIGLGAKLLYLPFTAIDTWGTRYKNSWSTETAKGYYTEFIGTANLAYNLLHTFYFNGVTVGGNVKFASRSVPESIAQGQSASTLLFDLGAVTKVNFLKFYYSRENNLALALTMKNLGLPVGGDPLPTSLVVGLAYSPIKPMTFSFDTNLPFYFTWPIGLDFNNAEAISEAVGFNWALLENLGVRAGLNFRSGSPRLSAGATILIDSLTMNFNYTVDLMTTLTPFDRVSIEVKMNLGDLGRQDRETSAREYYLAGLEFYAKGNLDQAIFQWDKALQVLPNFLPAKEMRDTAAKALELQAQMEASQKLQ